MYPFHPATLSCTREISSPCPDLISNDEFFHLQRFQWCRLHKDYRTEGKDHLFCEALSYAVTVNHGYRTRNVRNILLLLFGVKVFASYGCTFNGMKCGEHLIPRRHQSHFDKLDISCAQLVQLVTSYYCPDTVRIDLVKFFSSDFFAHQSSLSTLKGAFSNVKALIFDLTAKYGTIGAENVKEHQVEKSASLLAEAVLASEKPQLSTLIFDLFTPEDVPAVLRAVGPLFYQPLHAPRYYSEGALNALPYGGLKCLDMYASDGAPMDINEFVESTHEIETLLQAQCLTTITFRGFVESDKVITPFAEHGHPNFVLALSRFIQQPQFHCLHFHREAMHSSCMQLLLHTFLTTPCSHEQRLILKCVDLVEGEYIKQLQYNQTVPLPKSNIDNKHLEICACRGPEWFFRWLFSYAQLRLNTLKIGDKDEGEHMYIHDQTPLDDIQAFDWMIASHKDLQVPNLHFKYTDLKVDPACMEGSKKLIKLFQNPALKSLTLEGMTFECFFPYLLEGLQGRQDPLCSLTLLSTEIGKQPDMLIQRFFDILYSSPLLSEFELHLENNDFQPQHFEMIYQSWKKNSCGKRLKSFTFLEKDMLQDIRLREMSY